MERVIRYGLYALAGTGITLSSLQLTTEGQISPLEVDVKCQGSTPIITVQGDVPVEPNQTYWLVAEETGSRRFRVLKKSNDPKRWMFFERYEGFADPGSEHTELPVGRHNFSTGKESRFSIYSGSLSSRRTPFLDKIKYQVKKLIPDCSKQS